MGWKKRAELSAEEKLGIWDEAFCNRCGACCYFLGIKGFKEPEVLCKHLEIDKRKQTTCKLFNSKNRPKECKEWFCDLHHLRNPIQRSVFRQYALKLKSLPKKYRDKKYRT